MIRTSKPVPLPAALRALSALSMGAALAAAGPSRPVRILPLGDSITKSGHCAVAPDSSGRCPEGQLARSYRFHLAMDFRKRGWERDVDFVGSRHGPDSLGFDADHEGHGGWQAAQILRGNPDDTGAGAIGDWAEVRPDVALILLGTNDIAKGRAAADILADLGAIVDTLRAARPGIAIVLGRLIPMAEQWGFAGKARELNDSLPALAAALDRADSPVRLARLDSGMDRKRDYADSVHPNDAGCRKMADAWMSELAPLLRERFGFGDDPAARLGRKAPRPASVRSRTARDAMGRRAAPKLLVSRRRWYLP